MDNLHDQIKELVTPTLNRIRSNNMENQDITSPSKDEVVELQARLCEKRKLASAKAERIQLADMNGPMAGLMARANDSKKTVFAAGATALALAIF